jgi:LmbE family N-acetylglucosaminyl deacetylase
MTPHGKLLIVVAHPDDEYAFAATVYRLIRESGWVGDQVTITDGESGCRYATLAEIFYGVDLTTDRGRSHLRSIRKKEAFRAGKVLGLRRHHFLDQHDLGFDTDASTAESGNWDLAAIRSLVFNLLDRERYDLVLTLLPTAATHGHHRAATLLALDAASALPDTERPLILGVEPRSRSDQPLDFAGLVDEPLTRTVDHFPALEFDRSKSFGYRNALSYQIVVNWVIAEHKSQGLFQTHCGRHELEQFWAFEISGATALQRITDLQTLVAGPLQCVAAH